VGKAGRPRVAPDDPVELMNRLLRDAKLQNWDGTIAAEVKAQEITKRHELLAMVRGEDPADVTRGDVREARHDPAPCVFCEKPATRIADGRAAHMVCEGRAQRRASRNGSA
jgi:hypothetical protein